MTLEKEKARSVSNAIQSAFDILGPVSKQKLFGRLMDDYAVDIEAATLNDLVEIKRAINDIFGYDAASLLMKIVYSEVDSL